MIREYIIKISDEIMEEEIADRPQELIRCKDCKHRSKEMYDFYCDPNNKVYVCQIHDLAKSRTGTALTVKGRR